MKKEETSKLIKEKTVATKQVVAEITTPKIKNKKEFKYHLIMKFNNKIVDIYTDDLFESIKMEDPGFLKTKILFTISNDKGTCERMVFAHKGKMMFRNKMFLKTFINHLIFKPIQNG